MIRSLQSELREHVGIRKTLLYPSSLVFGFQKRLRHKWRGPGWMCAGSYSNGSKQRAKRCLTRLSRDERGFYCTDPESKQESREWRTMGSPPPQTEGRSLGGIKNGLFFWDRDAIVLMDWLAQNQTIMLNMIPNYKRNWEKQSNMKRGKLSKGILLHDNARPHTANLMQATIRDLSFETLPHPPYIPDLAPVIIGCLDNWESKYAGGAGPIFRRWAGRSAGGQKQLIRSGSRGTLNSCTPVGARYFDQGRLCRSSERPRLRWLRLISWL